MGGQAFLELCQGLGFRIRDSGFRAVGVKLRFAEPRSAIGFLPCGPLKVLSLGMMGSFTRV